MMRFVYFVCTVSVLLCSCNTRSNRTYFTINPEDRKIVLPVQINDSITTSLTFDTGARLGTLNLDSAFCRQYPDLLNKDSLIESGYSGSTWAEYYIPSSYYSIMFHVRIGNKNLMYSKAKVYNWKEYFSTSDSDGLFNIPENDTMYVWELNFENNYMKIHSAYDFKLPDNCFVAPMVEGKEHPYPFNIKLPIKVKCSNGDTLTLEHTFMIDTGMGWDIVLTRKENDKEYDFFNDREDAVWTSYLSHYHRYCTVDATLFNKVNMDSLRIYTFDYPNNVGCDYLIGQNFLKRFNVFFDMKRKVVGFQPIKNFKRIVNPIHQRFHFSYGFTRQGKMMVTGVGDYDNNRFKIAGLKEGDEIVNINGRPCKDFTWLEHRALEVEADTIVYDILRDGNPLKIVVAIDKSEIQGD